MLAFVSSLRLPLTSHRSHNAHDERDDIPRRSPIDAASRLPAKRRINNFHEREQKAATFRTRARYRWPTSLATAKDTSIKHNNNNNKHDDDNNNKTSVVLFTLGRASPSPLPSPQLVNLLIRGRRIRSPTVGRQRAPGELRKLQCKAPKAFPYAYEYSNAPHESCPNADRISLTCESAERRPAGSGCCRCGGANSINFAAAAAANAPVC